MIARNLVTRAAAILLLAPMASWGAVLTFGDPVDAGGGKVQVALNLKLDPGETLLANAMDVFLTMDPVKPIGLASGASYASGFLPPLTTETANFTFFFGPLDGTPLSDGPVVLWTFDHASNAPSRTMRFTAQLDVENLDPAKSAVLLADSAPPIPEPSSLALLAVGLSALGMSAARRKAR